MPKTETQRKRVVHQKASGGGITTGITGNGKKKVLKTSPTRAKRIKQAVVGDNARADGKGRYSSHALNSPPRKRGG